MLKTKKIFLFFYLFFVNIAFSQNDFENFQFRSIKEGISKRGAWTIAQDKDGYIWIGTNGAGLYKYDGLNYTVYESNWNNPKSINSNLIYTTYVDSQNKLWVGTEEGLCLYDRNLNRFETIDLKQALKINNNDIVTVRSLIEDNQGNLLIGTEQNGLLKLNLKTFKLITIKSDIPLHVELFIRGLAKNKQGKIFAATNFGLKYFDNKKNSIQQLMIEGDDHLNTGINDSLESIFFETNGNLWIGTTNDGLIKVVEKANGYHKEAFSITNKRIFSIIAIDSKNILCATENDGLFLINNSGKVVKKYLPNKFEKNGLKSNSIWSLMRDRDNRIWLGYYNKGVCIFDKLSGQFNSIESLLNNSNSLQSSSVTSITKDKSGKLWISMEGGGVDVFDSKTKKITHINAHDNSFISGLTNNNVQEVFIDSKQNVWLGVWNEGVFLLKKGSRKFINYNTKNTKGLSSDRVMSFAEDSKGNIWIGTFQSGLSYFDSSKNVFFRCDSKPFQEYLLPTSCVRKIIVDSDDILWVGTIRGLFGVKKIGNSFSVFSLKEKMSKILNNIRTHTILSLYESKNKLIWIGTDGSGLFNYNKKTKKISWFNDDQSVQEKSVSSITEDNSGSIWLSGRSGITKLDLKNNKFYNFNTEDGLLINDFNNNSVLKDEKGILYFGSYEGINYFDPNQMSKSTKQPLLYFKDLKIFNNSATPGEEDSPLEKVISETKDITLNHNQSVFTIEYVGINYSYPGKNEYAYYLEGFENRWNYVGNVRAATYTNLPPGNYVFKVKSAERGGSWSKKPLELRITVLAPWWSTNFAYFIYLVILVLSAYYIIIYYQNRFKAKQTINLEREKRIQIEKLNNKKLQFFTNISHEFRTPLTLIINPLNDLLQNNAHNLNAEVLNKLKVIHKSSGLLSRLINELMDFRKLQFNQVQLQVQEVEIISFVKDILSHFDEEATLRRIELSFSSPLKKLNDWIDPKMLEKIIFNILSNAFKVTPDYGSIKVRIKENNKRIYFPLINSDKEFKSYEIAIEDTGAGLDKKEIKKIFERFYQVNNLNKTYYGSTGIGLEVVKEFIELNKGKIEVDSVLGEKTCFRIIFPLGKEFFEADEFAKEPYKPESLSKVNFQDPKMIDLNLELVTNVKVLEKTHTILIVEDNSDLRSYLKEELKKEYKVIVAENGEKGYELAVQKLPDLILTDVIMPVMDGLEMCKKIKGNIKTSHIPLLMLSAKALVKDRLEGIDSGADLYLSKPFNMEILKSSLAQLINSRQIIFNKFYDGITKKAQQKTTTIDNDFMQKTLNYIHENISEPELSVESLASIVFLSRSQLYRKIKTLTGVSVNEFIRNVRLEKAKQLIEEGNDNINEISYKVGFSSSSYFTKCFKSKFGHLPTEKDKIVA
ncbi:hybrid sensor histidine kinase/response regulator transcription factor [Flavobacterium sp.]|uniref:hybrid sensor histidine kinase/response regulator transcription factor n=1 Tax=Flavobacterium sp. TaxID=239 RepID=UPI002C232A04|nr:two-component regulator propeller domain-containing protein [Flavobacterium sp.]HSD07675.1 two-component regulator propeller domain-containing protein [Flavobacterium sp.]